LAVNVSGDTYVGVTGQALSRRLDQHRKDVRFLAGFTAEVLGTAKDRDKANNIEAKEIKQRKPTLNKRKGGNSIGGYRSPRGNIKAASGTIHGSYSNRTHCNRGHELTSEIRAPNGSCRICARSSNRAWMLRKYGIGRGAD